MLLLLAKSSQSHPKLGHSPVGRLQRPWFESIPSGARQLVSPPPIEAHGKQRSGNN